MTCTMRQPLGKWITVHFTSERQGRIRLNDSQYRVVGMVDLQPLKLEAVADHVYNGVQ